jgi:hypothetical protein
LASEASLRIDDFSGWVADFGPDLEVALEVFAMGLAGFFDALLSAQSPPK